MRNEAETLDQLLSIPRRVAPRTDVIAWSDWSSGADLCPVYRADGSLWFVLDGATGNSVPMPPEPGSGEVMSDEQHLAWLHEMADKSDTRGKCYFIGGEQGAIKIGFSIDPPSRLKAIQAHSPIVVGILAIRDGGEARETAYHSQFAEHRLHGEWFERCPEILAEIARLNQQVPA